MAVIEDSRYHETTGSKQYFMPMVVSWTDYSPFGFTLSERSKITSNDKYRYGFNGMEKDDEVKGPGNSYTTLWRQYDPRLGRWLSIDPKSRKYSAWTPYNFVFNNPLNLTDPFGDDPPEEAKKHKIQEGETLSEIANDNDVSVDELVEWNEIEDPDLIYTGDELIVSNPKRFKVLHPNVIPVKDSHFLEIRDIFIDTENPEERWVLLKDCNGRLI